MGGCAWMLVGKVERLVSEAKSNYMHKARAADRNYHKDRAGIEDTRAREVATPRAACTEADAHELAMHPE
ncbi:hypothetical protein WN51_06331 [Melipona quadrifasciata]|uniref:Uncharacterized protein n=1 Tax=Melipona quadrifasciata TaxID=166423 RepID=A0A0N0U377_9HYME|nr:hypothetical protein WN51_06331 [Melipona quadrifasciata]